MQNHRNRDGSYVNLEPHQITYLVVARTIQRTFFDYLESCRVLLITRLPQVFTLPEATAGIFVKTRNCRNHERKNRFDVDQEGKE